jgi:hypothetical protein
MNSGDQGAADTDRLATKHGLTKAPQARDAKRHSSRGFGARSFWIAFSRRTSGLELLLLWKGSAAVGAFATARFGRRS